MSKGMIPSISNFILKGFCVCVALGLVACSNSNETLPELSIESVSIYTEPDTNQNSAIAVDLVIIYNEELVKLIGQMSAAKYFGSSRQLLLDNPTLLDIWHWELVPGQMVQGFEPPQEEGDAYAAFVFANYLAPGDHRIKVAPNGIVKVVLLRNDLKNLAVYDLHDARVGTTMSNAVDTTRDWCSVKGQDLCQMKLGPTAQCRQPCKRMGPKTTLMTQPGVECSPNYSPCQRKPIMTRPLRPPPRISHQPCRK
ncbi:MAG TPA: hypothetical protein VMW10_09145 [Alphaproteobacteria bacterium]|nr:hypothetical protein [Alphaproteobacteria bacterium]